MTVKPSVKIKPHINVSISVLAYLESFTRAFNYIFLNKKSAS